MLELRRIRTFLPEGSTTPEIYDKGFEPAIYYKHIDDMLARQKDIIDSIEASERHNLYITCNNVKKDKAKRGESWLSQKILFWDIDGVDDKDKPRYKSYEQSLVKVLGIMAQNIILIRTGSGFHAVIELEKPITKPSWFSDNSLDYQILCAQLNDYLQDNGLSGRYDHQVFAPNRMFRAPLSLYKKPGKNEATIEILSPHDTIIPCDIDIKKATGLPELDGKTDYMSDEELSYIKVDDATVQSGCKFLGFAKDRPYDLNEHQWYAMLSIVGRLKDGKKMALEYSKGHKGYNEVRTIRKLDQAIKSSGPRTCDNINKLWGHCNKCKHYKKVRSPIAIKGEDFIATAHSGFHALGAKGNLIPQYDDLRKYYNSKIPYINSASVHYRFEKTQWNEYEDVYIENYAEKKFVPPPKNLMCSEFRGKVKRTNLIKPAWFGESTDRKINFQNGVLDIDTMELKPHTTDYGFQDTLAFDYDPDAKAHIFKKMLDGVTCGDTSMQILLMEYLGYCISNDVPKADKILVLTGKGQNGKSRFLNVWRALGGSAVRSLGVSDITNPFHLQKLDGCLFNVMEEVPEFSDRDYWETMKNLASGGSVTASRKFKDPYDFANKAKFVMTCNELPKGASQNHGYFRRLIICEFRAVFDEMTKGFDRDIDRKVVEGEMSGVANIALKMYQRLRENNYSFTKSQAVESALESYKLEMDSVARWVDDHVEIGEPSFDNGKAPGWIQKTSSGETVAVIEKMREHYFEWCQMNGDRAVNLREFSKRLLVRCPVLCSSKSIGPSDRMGVNVTPMRKKQRVDGARVSTLSNVTWKK